MKNILVSGTSGIVGYGILRSLKKSGLDLNLIGTTIYEDSVAQGFCDTFEKAPPTNSDIYIDWLMNTINKHKIQMLIPGIEADLYKWTECKDKIEATGAKILLNNLDLVSFSKDKWVFYQQLITHKLTMAIPTILETDFEKCNDIFTYDPIDKHLVVKTNESTKCVTSLNENSLIAIETSSCQSIQELTNALWVLIQILHLLLYEI